MSHPAPIAKSQNSRRPLADLVANCRVARNALAAARSSIDDAAIRARQLQCEIARAEAQQAAEEIEAAALEAAGGTKPAIRSRLGALRAELEAAERVQTGAKAAIASRRAALRDATDALNVATQAAVEQLRATYLEKFNEAVQTMRDAFAVIGEIDDRPLLASRTEIADIEPGARVFRDAEPSGDALAALAPFADAISEVRRATMDLDPTI